ncbi:cupin domain-containing protein [Jiulongibacter sp. NS-SX5]|uniref:cupin domain-containing protein n=1 Tax=Jiulongibacter sp. NS-SX5 TaxID=3463854 RepID=UPI0040583E41
MFTSAPLKARGVWGDFDFLYPIKYDPMKSILSGLSLFFCLLTANAQVRSIVYDFNSPVKSERQNGMLIKTHFDDECLDFQQMVMKSFHFEKDQTLHLKSSSLEQLVIIKTGDIDFELGTQNMTMGPGSIALVLPGDLLKMNAPQNAEVYLMQYQAKEGQSYDRGEENGGSFLMNWDEITYEPHDKGGVRHYYKKPTAACKRMEMHVSNLNPGIKSHEPHTHRAPEVILMTKGSSEMEIDGKVYPATAGDIYFVESMVPHAIKNIDTEQIQYFAYQFE